MRLLSSLGLAVISTVALGKGQSPLPAAVSNSQYARHVNPFIGTAGEGYTFPGPVLPWGMAAVSPHTTYTSALGYATGQLIAPAGYRYGQASIDGFGQSHLSGVGCPALGAPVIGVQTGSFNQFGYRSSYQAERATAGYYSVFLDDFDTRVELTATKRSGVHRFTFPGHRPGHILIDASRNLSWASPRGHVERRSPTEVVGWAQVGNFCFKGEETRIYFAAKVNQQPAASGLWDGLFRKNSSEETGLVGAWFSFAPDQRQVELYVGLSHTSMDNALANLRAETTGQTFDSLLAAAVATWDKQLGKIAVSGGSPQETRTFYTALYHSLLHPNVVSDSNGDFPYYGKSGKGNDPQHERYGVFSLWDTYRSLHSLLSLVYPAEQQAMLYSLEAMTAEAGRPPQWELGGHEVNMMVGDPALSVLAEGYQKGFHYRDAKKLFASLYRAASASDTRRPGNKAYLKRGYVPHKTSDVWGAVSTSLEYSYHDWALGAFAQALGEQAPARELAERAAGWQHLFDASTATLRPKDTDGQWLDPFDPTAARGDQFMKLGGPGYVEGNAYQYSYMLPHGMTRLIELHGGATAFVENLSQVFSEGHFALWNEPDLSYPYLFGYADQLGLTQEAVAKARRDFFADTAPGLPGNDDTGALSSWYVFSALGFYPVNPVAGGYRFGIPLFPRVQVQLDQSKSSLLIERGTGVSTEVGFNGAPLSEGEVTHASLQQGGVLSFGGSAS